MRNLAQQESVPAQSGTPALKGGELHRYAAQVDAAWHVVNEHHLEREFKFKDFRQALGFINRVGELAESINHHPDICFGWGYAKLTLCTHSINGLSANDFIFAAKVDALGV